MNIAILGAGSVGGALATAWSSQRPTKESTTGHTLTFGVRNPSDAKAVALAQKLGARVATVADAVRSSDFVVLATPWPATKSAIESCGSLAGKVVIDCTNPLAPDLSGLSIGHATSAAEHVAQWAAGASVYKCFNQTGASNMDGSAQFAAKPVMFVAGDDATHKPQVLQLAAEAGFEALDAGPLTMARLLEPLAMLWIKLAFSGQGRDFAFALTRRTNGAQA